MFSRVLVANRGLIQANCIRAVQELGATAIAVFEAEDKNSAGVRNADESFELKLSSSVRAYFDIDQIIDLAKNLKVDAVHPGYGFLAQNSDFAERLKESGIQLIATDLAGDSDLTNKPHIKKLADQLGLLTLPGSSICKDFESVQQSADSTGYPLIIKSIHGYGGKGLRAVLEPGELKSAYEFVLSRCEKFSLKSKEVYIEKFFNNAHHIEFPVLRDKNGNIVIFPEQWGSIQRRNQKILVETPSRVINSEKRNKLISVIGHLVQKLNIHGFASIAFLVDNEYAYFLEVNGHIQPFYSATGLLTGVDLIKEQIRIISGENLKLKQERIVKSGHVIGAAICAEDPSMNFTPSPGKIDRFYPPFGQGIFVQSNVFSGDAVSTYYDPVIAKAMVRERTRKDAIEKMKVALSDFFIDGIKTNIPFIRAILASTRFQSRDMDLSYLQREENRRKLLDDLKDEEGEQIATMIAAIALHNDSYNLQILDPTKEGTQNSLWATASRWISRKKLPY